MQAFAWDRCIAPDLLRWRARFSTALPAPLPIVLFVLPVTMPAYSPTASVALAFGPAARVTRTALLATLLALASLTTAPQRAWAQAEVATQVRSDYQAIETLIQQRRFDDAIAAADLYLSHNARDPQVRFLKGVAQTGAGLTDAAIASFSELIQVYPELPEPYNNLAALYAGQGDYGKARDALLQAVEANPDYAVAHENLGDIYIQLAAEQYRTAQQLDSRNRRLAPKLRLTEQLLSPSVP